MKPYQPALVIIASILAVLSYVPYVASILKGKTKPSRTTFGVWTLISIVEVSSYAASGARSTLLLPLIYALGAIVVFLLSVKRGVGGTKSLDIVCLAGAVVGVIGWLLTNNPHVALYLSIISSGFGFLPTIKKAYLQPETEDALAWGLAGVAALLNLIAVSNWAIYNISYPLYMLIFDGTVALLTIFPESFRKDARAAKS